MLRPMLPWLLLIAIIATALPAPAPANAQQQQAPPAQAPPATQQDQTSVADAARKTKEAQEKSKAKKVYTDEDMTSLSGPVSVVGEKKSAPAASDADKPGTGPAIKDEAYWRSRYQELSQKMDAVDKQIADLQEDIRKYGKGGSNATQGAGPAGPGQNACVDQVKGQAGTICQAIVNDREAQLKDLEKKKADIQKQIDDLQDEARKAGVDPGWVR